MNEKKHTIWGQEFPVNLLGGDVHEYLAQYSAKTPSIDEIWREMDRVWDELRLSNASPLLGQPIGDYYSHPVWVLNGLFSASDPDSSAHRDGIVNCVLSLHGKTVADYGGGFGELAIRLASKLPDGNINIIEPYPSAIGHYRISKYSNISILAKLGNNYDVVIAQDVLEHVEDPISLVIELSNAVKLGGHIIFANCFYPVIKCHLPTTFHLRHTFSWVVKAAGLKMVGTVTGVPHSQIFKKIDGVDQRKIRRKERYSKIFGPVFNLLVQVIKNILRPARNLLKYNKSERPVK